MTLQQLLLEFLQAEGQSLDSGWSEDKERWMGWKNDMQVKVRKGKCEKWAVHGKREDAMSAIGQMRDEDATEVVEVQTETVMKWREEE